MVRSIDFSIVAGNICKTNDLTLIKRVGGGGCKETFQVSTKDGTVLALKIYHPGVKPERTAREIESMTRCFHPGIAKIFSIATFNYEKEEYTYLTEEFIGGGTLSEKLINGIFDIPSVIDLGNQLFSVITHIAELGLVHRDIKPDNILFRENSTQAVVTDFGIVRDLNAESITESFLMSGPGTLGFSAPEQMNNQKPMENWRTDQFACGIVLSMCGLGIHPYGDNIPEIANNIGKYGNTTTIFKERVKTSGLVVLEKMVSAYPARRFRTIPELIMAWNNQGV